jgi:hypothetical protein
VTNMYLVEPIKQPNWSACWYTALAILERFRQQRMGLQLVTSAELAEVVYQPKGQAQKAVNLFNRANINPFLMRLGFGSRTIETTPDTFVALIAERGPFAYVAAADNPMYQHTLVITGIHRGLYRMYTVFYIDPVDGHHHRAEFYAFMREHLPAWGDAAFVVTQ